MIGEEAAQLSPVPEEPSRRFSRSRHGGEGVEEEEEEEEARDQEGVVDEWTGNEEEEAREEGDQEEPESRSESASYVGPAPNSPVEDREELVSTAAELEEASLAASRAAQRADEALAAVLAKVDCGMLGLAPNIPVTASSEFTVPVPPNGVIHLFPVSRVVLTPSVPHTGLTTPRSGSSHLGRLVSTLHTAFLHCV